jgi:protein-S-isoprenylcysteine O-methyltransferase Ste14
VQPQTTRMPHGPERLEGATTGAPAANRSRVRPPMVYVGAILAGSVLDVARPSPFLPDRVCLPLGASLIAAAVALFVSSIRAFRAAGTPVRGNRPTATIVRDGPYRRSRNPIYLAFSLGQLGLATWADSLWLLVTLAVAVAYVTTVAIPREERYLERTFGAAYLDYKAHVRRWI